MSPGLLKVIGVLVALASLVVALMYAYNTVHDDGVEQGQGEQQKADQKTLDDINVQLSKQKADADALYLAKVKEVLDTVKQRDAFKKQLGEANEKDRLSTEAHHVELAGQQLRFATSCNPTNAGGGGSGGSAASPGGTAAANDATTIVQLPAKITSDLRQLAFDADRLADEYRKCYGYANKRVTPAQ